MLAAAPLLLLLGAELLVRLFAASVVDDPYLTLTTPVSVFTEVDVGGVPHYRVTHPDAYRAANVEFPVAKPPDTLRIFCLGGSANAGWPHPPGHAWSDYLAQALQRALPASASGARRVEVINLGAHAYASYRVRMIFDDAMRCRPDIVVIFSGNNEFVERRSYLLDFPGKRVIDWLERRSALVGLASRWWRQRNAPRSVLSGEHREDAEFHLWTHTERQAAELRSDPAQFAQVREHYRYSIDHMVATCVAAGVRAYVLTVPVNLRDWEPAVSAQSLAPGPRAAWERDYRNALADLVRGDPAGALAPFDTLVEAESEHAEVRFFRGRAREATGDLAGALADYVAASDLDRNPFRCPSGFHDVVRSVVAAHPPAKVVEAAAAFRAAAAHVAPGFDLFLDYVHPSRAGNILLARTVFEAMAADGALGADVGAFEPPTDAYRDEADPFLQITLLGLFGIMHQYQAFLDRIGSVEAMFAAAGTAVPARVTNVMANTKAAFAEYLTERRKELLGEPFDPGYQERHHAFYREFFNFAASVKSALDEPAWRERQGRGR